MIELPLSADKIAEIKRTYMLLCKDFIMKDGVRKTSNRVTLIALQDIVNEYAMKLYDIHGRCIISVFDEKGNFAGRLDLTSPRIRHNKETIAVDFGEVDDNGFFIKGS